MSMDQYRGALSITEAVQGMNAARRNAKRLAEDARLLLEAGRYPSAASLAILSIEESGKEPILRGLARNTDPAVIKSKWQAYRNHRTKNVIWVFPKLADIGVETFAGFSPFVNPKNVHSPIMDALKQQGFYTDAVGEGDDWEWLEPADSVPEAAAEKMLELAERLARYGEVTEREIELWVEHVGDDEEQAGAENLRNFWKAMLSEGLTTIPLEQVEQFLGIDPSE
jgi:AbiV family abortive infection protein